MALTLADAIVHFKGDDSQLNKDIDKSHGKVRSFAGGATKLLGGALVGGAVAAGAAVAAIGTAAFNVSAQTDQVAKDMAASLRIPQDQAEEFADVAKRVYGNNFADSVNEAGEAVTTVQRVLGDLIDQADLQQVTEGAFALRDAFGVEVNESVSAAKTLMSNFGLSSQEAFDMIASGFQNGLNRSGDFLESVEEYSTQFANGGANASEFFSLMQSGMQGGMLGTDKAADAFKEFRVRIADGSKSTSEALSAIGLSAEDITQRMSDGTLTAADAFEMVQKRLAETEDPVARMQSGVGLMGTQFEDLGDDAALALDMTKDWAKGSEGSIDSLNTQYDTFGQAVQGIWRRLVLSVEPFTEKLLQIVNDAMPKIMSAFDTFDRTVGPAMESARSVIDRVVSAIQTFFSNFGGSVDENGTGTLKFFKQWIDENLPKVQQIFDNVLGAIKVFWDLFGDDIMNVVDVVFRDAIQLIDTILRNILDVVSILLDLLTGDFDSAGETLKGIVDRTWQAVQDIIGRRVQLIKDIFGDIDWAGIGSAIIDGIANGISSAAGRVAEAAQDAAQSAYDRAKSWLGISSPSKKAAEDIGKPFAEGIAEGANKELGNISGQINRGLAGMMGSLQAQPMGAGMGGVNITVHVGGRDATYEGGRAAGRGVLDELRSRGLA